MKFTKRICTKCGDRIDRGYKGSLCIHCHLKQNSESQSKAIEKFKTSVREHTGLLSEEYEFSIIIPVWYNQPIEWSILKNGRKVAEGIAYQTKDEENNYIIPFNKDDIKKGEGWMASDTESPDETYERVLEETRNYMSSQKENKLKKEAMEFVYPEGFTIGMLNDRQLTDAVVKIYRNRSKLFNQEDS